MLKNIRANAFAFAVWTLFCSMVHIVLFKTKVNTDHHIMQRILIAITAVVFILFVHEFIHFVFMKIFYKGKVKIIFAKDTIGFPIPGVSAEGEARKWQKVIMLLAPLIFLTLLLDIVFVFCAKIELFFFVVTMGNCAGCFYDIIDACMEIKRKDNDA